MKKILSFSLVLLLITSMTSIVYAKDNGIKVSMDQKNVSFTDSVPFIDANSRTLVPLRAIGEAMGLDVVWDGAAKTATFTRVYTVENTPGSGVDTYVGKETVAFTIGSKQGRLTAYFYAKDYIVQGAGDKNYYSDGWTNISMDTAAILKDGRTYAPVKYLAEAFRVEAKWNSGEKTVELYSSKTPGQVGLLIEEVGFWGDYQAWVYYKNKDAKIKSVETIEVLKDGEALVIREIAADEKSALEEFIPEIVKEGKYLTGTVVNSQLEYEHFYKYTFKLLITMENGTQEKVVYNDYIYFEGEGGYI